MISHVGRMFNVSRKEFAPAILLFFYLFLVMGAFMMGKAVGDSMFLNVYPRHLPVAMIGSALLSGPFVLLYIRMSHRLRLELLINGTLLFFAASFALFWWLTRLEHVRWVYMLVYIWVYTMGAMGPMMGWTLANFLLTTREARRIFGLIQAGAILGVPFVSFVTADILKHGHAPPEGLLLGITAFMVVCAVLVRLLFVHAKERTVGLALAPAASQDAPKNFRQSTRAIRQSPYLLLIAALIFCSCISTCILDYQYKLIARAFITDKVALAAFFARFNGYMGMATFVLNLALTGALLRRFGIRVTLFILPLTLLVPTTAVLLAPTLLVAVILRGSHYLLRYSVDKSSAELLYLPIASGVKSQVKSFMDTFVWRSADGVAGLILLLFATVLKFSPGRISLVNFGLLAGWIAIVYGVRREYLNVLRKAIERHTLRPDRTVAGVLDSTTTDVLAMCLEKGQERQVLYSLSLFEMGRGSASHPALREQLKNPSPDIRKRVLRLLAEAGDKEVLPQVEKMLGDESLEVRVEALNYLVVQTGRDPLTLLTTEGDFPDYCVQSSLIAYLTRMGLAENLPTAQLLLHDMISRAGPEGPRARADAARVLGVIPAPSDLHAELPKLLRDEDPGVVAQAVVSAGKVQSRECLPLVIEKLGDPRLVATARLALTQYGERALGTLEDYLKDPDVSLAVRKEIPQLLARIPTAESGAMLANCMIQSDPGLRYEVLKALNKLRRRDPALLPPRVDFADLLDIELMGYYRSFQISAAFDPRAGSPRRSKTDETVLTRALRERMEHELERIFRLLALVYPPRDVHNAFVGLTSGRAHLHANALEVLENLLRPDLYKRLAYGLDPEVSLQEKLSYAQRLCGTSVNSKQDALRILLHSDDPWLRACALYAVGEMGAVELSSEVRRLSHEGDPVLAETWRWTSRRLAISPAV